MSTAAMSALGGKRHCSAADIASATAGGLANQPGAVLRSPEVKPDLLIRSNRCVPDVSDGEKRTRTRPPEDTCNSQPPCETDVHSKVVQHLATTRGHHVAGDEQIIGIILEVCAPGSLNERPREHGAE
jgi:hypothetical protein